LHQYADNHFTNFATKVRLYCNEGSLNVHRTFDWIAMKVRLDYNEGSLVLKIQKGEFCLLFKQKNGGVQGRKMGKGGEKAETFSLPFCISIILFNFAT